MRGASAGRVVLGRLGGGLRTRLGVSLLVFAGYFLAAFLAKNFYPFSMFDMYAGQGQPSASRIVARDSAGRLHPVRDYVGWQCPEPVNTDPEQCQAFPFYYIPYVDAGTLRYLRSHSAEVGAGARVDLVFHIWRLGPGGIESEQDCVIQRCRAVR